MPDGAAAFQVDTMEQHLCSRGNLPFSISTFKAAQTLSTLLIPVDQEGFPGTGWQMHCLMFFVLVNFAKEIPPLVFLLGAGYQTGR